MKYIKLYEDYPMHPEKGISIKTEGMPYLVDEIDQNNPNSKKTIQIIQSPDFDVNQSDEEGWSLLMAACSRGHIEIVNALLQHSYIDVNEQDNLGRTALMIACQLNQLYCVQALLKHPDINTGIKEKRLGMVAWDFATPLIKRHIPMF